MSNISNCLNFTNCTENVSEDGKSTSVIWTMIKIPIFTAVIGTALTGNILVCLAVCKFRQLQTTTNYAIVSLAVTDVLMVYVMVLHAVMVIEGEWNLGVTLCDVTSTIGLTLNLISLVHLTYISFDRYIAITKPFRYQVWMTKPRVALAMALLWFFSCFILNLPWADFKYRSNVFGCVENVKRGKFRLSTLIMLLAFVSVPTMFILFAHISIFRIARGHAIRVQNQENNLNRSFQQPSSLQPSHSDSNRISLTIALKRELKSVKTFAIVVGCFLICYVPFYTVATTRSFKGLHSVPNSVLTTVTWIGFFNSCINPILYSLRHQQFKTAFKKIFDRGIERIFPRKAEQRRHRRIMVATSSGLGEWSVTRGESFTMRNAVKNVSRADHL